MIYSKHRFTLEMQAAHSQIAIPVTVGDTGKIFYINLTDGGEPYKVTDGSLAVLTIHRPTGTYLQAFCPIKNNSTIVYDFLQNENTAVVEGIYNCELTLYGPTTEGVISTSWFTMVVNPRVVNSDNLIITDENRTAIDAMLAAEATRQSNEEARVSAESGRVSAEEKRETYYENFVERVNNGEFDGAPDIKTYMNGGQNGSIKSASTIEFEASDGIGLHVKDGRVLIGIDNTTFPGGIVDGETSLPEVTNADNGKILMVVGGQWENVKFPAGEQTEYWIVTALADNWSSATDEENNPIYENWVSNIENNLENCSVRIALHAKSTAEQIAEARRCGVYCHSTDMSQIRFVTSYDTAPTCDLKFKVEIVRPNTLSYSVDDETMTLTIMEGYNDATEQE